MNESMLIAPLLAEYKWVGEKMLIIVKWGSRNYFRSPIFIKGEILKMIVEDGKQRCWNSTKCKK